MLLRSPAETKWKLAVGLIGICGNTRSSNTDVAVLTGCGAGSSITLQDVYIVKCNWPCHPLLLPNGIF